MASLTVTTGPHAGDYYPLGRRTLVIGRDEGCPAQIVDDQVSRKHAQVRWTDGRYVVLDMKSANGTLVNGRPLTGELELADGDEITVGNSRLMFSERERPCPLENPWPASPVNADALISGIDLCRSARVWDRRQAASSRAFRCGTADRVFLCFNALAARGRRASTQLSQICHKYATNM